MVQSSHLCLTSCSPVISNMGTWVAQWHLAQGKMCILKLPFLPLMIPRLNGEQVSKLLWVITLIRPQLIRGRSKNKRSAVVENQSRGPGRRTKRCHRVPERKKRKIKRRVAKIQISNWHGRTGVSVLGYPAEPGFARPGFCIKRDAACTGLDLVALGCVW